MSLRQARTGFIPHQVDEYVDTAEVVDAARIYVASALNYLGLG